MTFPLALYFACLAVALGLAVFSIIRNLRSIYGHRKAARDRDDSDTGAIFTPFYALHALGAGETPREGTRLKTSTAEVPILAFKGARIAWRPNYGPVFKPLHHGYPYGLEADAECRSHGVISSLLYGRAESHVPIPDPGCSCGFYACKSPDDVDDGSLLLTVELSGRVLVCESGYRSQHQSVVGAQFRGCHYCGSRDIERAEFEEEGMMKTVCVDHVDPDGQRYLTVHRLSKCLGITIEVGVDA